MMLIPVTNPKMTNPPIMIAQHTEARSKIFDSFEARDNIAVPIYQRVYQRGTSPDTSCLGVAGAQRRAWAMVNVSARATPQPGPPR
jgi:hypothetical protein